jgi:SOS-response transcriptional repressor LexA
VDCLQTFRNGYYHKHLDRKAAQERLVAWGSRLSVSHDIPAKQPSQEPVEGRHPVNEVERRLRHLLLAAGFEEGIRGQQIRLDRAIGTTTPDVIYRAPHHAEDEGVCIYLDGLSGHLHGNPATAEQDQRIRTWLRNNSYEVIEIAVSDLHDEAAMARHFRRLAGYLGANRLRDSLRTDTSWFQRAAEAGTSRGRVVLRIVRPRPEERYVACVPRVPLRAAAGAFSNPQNVADGDWEWVEIDTYRRLRPGMFVAQVVGKSMEPAIPDGSYCLFASPVTGTRQGRTILVQLRDSPDPETGERYTVKRYESEKVTSEDGTWRHVKITLKPNNPEFTPIELTCEDEGTVQVVAEMLEVLG